MTVTYSLFLQLQNLLRSQCPKEKEGKAYELSFQAFFRETKYAHMHVYTTLFCWEPKREEKVMLGQQKYLRDCNHSIFSARWQSGNTGLVLVLI